MTRGRSQILGCLLLMVIGIPLCLSCLAVSGIVALVYTHDADQETYNKVVREWLGVGGGDSSIFSLSEGDARAVKSKGLDPQAVANALAVASWLKSTFKVDGDPGLYLAIHQYESAGGTNMGTCKSGIAAAQSNRALNAAMEGFAARKLLSIWKENDIRSTNPIAAKYVREDYSNYQGHCSAGEMGAGGFIPTTAYKVCMDGLSKSSDPQVKACDFWSQKTEFHAIAYWVYAIGYRNNLSSDQKVAKLRGWNLMLSYRQKLVSRALEVSNLLGGIASGVLQNASEALSTETAQKVASLGEEYNSKVNSGFGDTSDQSDLKSLALSILQELDLMPEAIASEGVNEASTTTAGGKALPIGVLSSGSGQISLDLTKEAPVADGESYNVALWAKLNSEISLPVGGTWDFCTATNSTGWGEYKFAANINAGGICINASMVYDWALANGLTIVHSAPHQKLARWPRFTIVINCPGTSLTIKNNTSEEIIGIWTVNGDMLSLGTLKGASQTAVSPEAK